MPGKVNESKWSDAKAAARKQCGSKLKKDRFYAVVSTIYKSMGGHFKKKASICRQEEINGRICRMKGLAKIAVVVKQPAADYYSDLDITPDPEFVGYNTRLHPELRTPERLGTPFKQLYGMLYDPALQERLKQKELMRKKQKRMF